MRTEKDTDRLERYKDLPTVEVMRVCVEEWESLKVELRDTFIALLAMTEDGYDDEFTNELALLALDTLLEANESLSKKEIGWGKE